ncbi:MAG: 4-(cytidine 5'-diphospho)-2-C-methyl-D-erythritol kinase [Clostridia bacterium]|nr:4-(cytidine 5'-diphospho)-2-C-methyl-D-erythritol kinase [Clostridia bacterium]
MRTERANAKINTYLDVISKRENGYHNVVSIMQTVSLCDLVSVEYRPGIHTSIRMEASGNDAMPVDCRNLAWRAAEKLLQRIERSGEVQIIIQKRIPMAAGLAGGSADAAAVLRALNALCGSPLSVEELCALGATLGADVPFCIRGGSARVSGIGDCMEEIASMPQGLLVVACRGEGVSTPWAYGELDRRYNDFADRKKDDNRDTLIENAWKNGDLQSSCEHFFNLFEEVVPAVQKDVNALKRIMTECGALRAMMSGSGPSVFGVFEDASAADAACARLREAGAAAFVCHPCEKYRF